MKLADMDYYRSYFLCSLIILLGGCSPHVSEYFDSTQYVKSFNTHIVNDSLQLYLKTPADIRYDKSKEAVLEHVRDYHRRFDGLLVYGQTELSPHYEFYLMLNPGKMIEAKNEYEIVRDTLIQNNELVMFCRSDETSYSDAFRSDCLRIFESISTDKNYRDGMASIFDLTKRIDNRYYQGLEAILNYPAKGRNEEFLQLQMAINFASFLAPAPIYDSLLNEFPAPPVNDSLKKVIKSRAIQESAEVKETLLREAKNHRLVMINESHFYPNHRRLLTKLLPRLKRRGFTHLALEALGQGQDSLLNAGHPPTVDTGFYTREQHFADLIRAGQRLGFTFVSYENADPKQGREQGQADNLFAKTFAQSDSARVLMLVGVDHILEQPTQDGRSWLAHILREQYDLDPLTISQSHLNTYHRLGKPLALLPGHFLQDSQRNSVDWLLLNNLPLTDSSSNYAYSNSYDRQVQIAVFFNSELGQASEFEDKVPYRTSLVRPGETVKYHLPPQRFFVVIYDKSGEVLEERRLSLRKM